MASLPVASIQRPSSQTEPIIVNCFEFKWMWQRNVFIFVSTKGAVKMDYFSKWNIHFYGEIGLQYVPVFLIATIATLIGNK